MIGYHWNRKKTGERVKMYTCSSHHFQGKKVCTRNTIPEASLVDCVVRIIQQRYLSPENLDRLREALRQQQTQNSQPEPLDTDRVRKRAAELDRRIDNGAERIFSAPSSLTSTLYKKLEQLRAERDRVHGQLEDAKRRLDGTDQQGSEAVENAISALRDLGGAFENADPVPRATRIPRVADRPLLRPS